MKTKAPSPPSLFKISQR